MSNATTISALVICGQAGGTGKVNAYGDAFSAGIGGCSQDGNCGFVTINGGEVTASGGECAAGIGGGNAGKGGTVVINGGVVTATTHGNGAGIGSAGAHGDAGCTVVINGGEVNATGGGNAAGIGGGNSCGGGNVIINGGEVNATGGGNDYAGGAGIGGGCEGKGGFVTINGGTVTARGAKNAAGIGCGPKGLSVTVTISGGTVTAIGSGTAAGIGGGGQYYGDVSGVVGGAVTISGGTVIATGGTNYGAGIGGGGYTADGGTVAITGGDVTATGGNLSPAIGGSEFGTDCAHGTLTFAEGMTFVIQVKKPNASAWEYVPQQTYSAQIGLDGKNFAHIRPGVALSLTGPREGYSYAVSNRTDGASVPAYVADGKSVCAFATNDAYAVDFVLGDIYQWVEGKEPAENPIEGTISADTEITDEAEAELAPMTFTLPTGLPGCAYVVSNLTEGAEGLINPTEQTAGGATYVVTGGLHVAIYCIAADGYMLEGQNPYDIPMATKATTIPDGKLPYTRLPASATLVSVAQRYPWNGKVDVVVDLEHALETKAYSLGLVFTAAGETVGFTNALESADGRQTVTVDFAAILPEGTVADAHVDAELIEAEASGGDDDDLTKPFCVTAETRNMMVGFVGFENLGAPTDPWSPNLEYSTDGENWQQLETMDVGEGAAAYLVPLQDVGDKVYFRGNNPEGLNSLDLDEWIGAGGVFAALGMEENDEVLVSLSGNIMSLVDPTLSATEIPDGSGCFACLFWSQILAPSILSAKRLQLPATKLKPSCYAQMFAGQEMLLDAPELPAEMLEPMCYLGMFGMCGYLRDVKMMATDVGSEDDACLEMWLMGAGEYSGGGTLTINPEATWYQNPGDAGEPEGWTVKPFEETSPCEAFCVTAETPNMMVGFIDFNRLMMTQESWSPNLEYSYDGENWLALAETSVEGIPVPFPIYFVPNPLQHVGDKVYFRGDNPNGLNSLNFTSGGGSGAGGAFVALGMDSEALVSLSGNIMSLVDSTMKATEIPGEAGCFAALFYGDMVGASILSAKRLQLPATTLKPSCYASMFAGQGYLLDAPELPAETLAPGCYMGMFAECESLRQVKMMATDVGGEADGCLDGWLDYAGCYLELFHWETLCGTLTINPEATWYDENPESAQLPNIDGYGYWTVKKFGVTEPVLLAAPRLLGAESGEEGPVVTLVGEKDFALDLIAGDRLAKGTESIVVDPAWGAASEATVTIDGESNARTYTSATVDTWATGSLKAGRYALAFTAGEGEKAADYSAAFWKAASDWTVLDRETLAGGMTLESGKTYLVLGVNTVTGGKFKVELGAHILYGADSGFRAGEGGSFAALPRTHDLVETADYCQFVEKPAGTEGNPWAVGAADENVGVWTNAPGGALTLNLCGEGEVEGFGSVPGWDDLKDDVKAVIVDDADVTGAAEDAFAGIGGGAFKLELADGWQGALPTNAQGEVVLNGFWYGAEVELEKFPLAVRNVRARQRYPWNGKVDVVVDVTGAGKVKLGVKATDGGRPLPVAATVGAEIDLGDAPGSVMNGVRMVWDAGADVTEAEFKSDAVEIKVSAERAE